MTTAEKAKEAVLERVAVLAKDAQVTDLFALTDTIGRITGESTKHMDVLADTLSKLLTTSNFGESKNKEVKK